MLKALSDEKELGEISPSFIYILLDSKLNLSTTAGLRRIKIFIL